MSRTYSRDGQPAAYETGEYDESPRGNFVCEVYTSGRIVVAEYADRWQLTYYDGSDASFRKDAPKIIAVARELHDRVWAQPRRPATVPASH